MAGEALQSLARISVLDASSGVAGPYAASLLAGMGARVRRLAGAATPATPVEAAHAEGLRRYLSRGVDCIDPGSGADLDRLLAESDVLFVSDRRTDAIQALREQGPRLVIVSITPFGLEGPEATRPGSAFVAAAKAGWLFITGEAGREPLRLGGHAAELAAGWAAFSGALLGLWERRRTGEGALVDLALLEVFVYLQWMATQRAAYEGVTVERAGGRGAGHPWGVYRCKDGHVIVIVGAGGRNWAAFADLMETPELRDPKYATARSRAQHADEIDALMYRWLLKHDARTVYERAQAAGLPFGMVATVPDLFSDRQLRARAFLSADEDGVRLPGIPFRYNGVRPAGFSPAGRRPGVELGETR
jgi:crotonobetainyl-CoA:carnitine CoA-transferase CaiB-like acyl-CoA transferase